MWPVRSSRREPSTPRQPPRLGRAEVRRKRHLGQLGLECGQRVRAAVEQALADQRDAAGNGDALGEAVEPGRPRVVPAPLAQLGREPVEGVGVGGTRRGAALRYSDGEEAGGGGMRGGEGEGRGDRRPDAVGPLAAALPGGLEVGAEPVGEDPVGGQEAVVLAVEEG